MTIFGGIVSSGDVSSDTWTCSGHYAGFAYTGLEPYEVAYVNANGRKGSCVAESKIVFLKLRFRWSSG